MDLKKRKWKPIVNKKTDKWFTGYYVSVKNGRNTEAKIVDRLHEKRTLYLKYKEFDRGRSSVSFYFVDRDEYEYSMSASGVSKLLKNINDIVEKDGYYVLTCVQVKQGTEISISPIFGEQND